MFLNINLFKFTEHLFYRTFIIPLFYFLLRTFMCKVVLGNDR